MGRGATVTVNGAPVPASVDRRVSGFDVTGGRGPGGPAPADEDRGSRHGIAVRSPSSAVHSSSRCASTSSGRQITQGMKHPAPARLPRTGRSRRRSPWNYGLVRNRRGRERSACGREAGRRRAVQSAWRTRRDSRHRTPSAVLDSWSMDRRAPLPQSPVTTTEPDEPHHARALRGGQTAGDGVPEDQN